MIGRFSENRDSSHWLSFVPSAGGDEGEHYGSTFKFMKRQIKRAFPELLEKSREKIVIRPFSHGKSPIELTGHQTLKELGNLWISSRFVGDQNDVLGGFNQAAAVIAGMGFSREEVPARMAPNPEPPVAEA